MAEHPNVDLLRNAYNAFSRGDMDALSEAFAKGITWHILGTGPMNGDRKGPQEVFEFFGWLAQESEGTLRVELHDVLANDEHGVALVEVTAERKGQTLQQKVHSHISH
jgi:ketosteroid isomerase-like protein